MNQGAVVNRHEGHYRGDENVLQLVMLTRLVNVLKLTELYT